MCRFFFGETYETCTQIEPLESRSYNNWSTSVSDNAAKTARVFFKSNLPFVKHCMSAASPFGCCDVLEPPTSAFNFAHLKPDVIVIEKPNLSRTGCNAFIARFASDFSICGVTCAPLSMPFRFAVFDAINSSSVKFFERYFAMIMCF